MRPLTLDDLLPLDEYAGRRREFFESQGHYLDRYRRVRLGPRLTLLFANRQTLWFQVQELLRVARLLEPTLVQRELDLYNRLLPSCDRLQAALLLEVPDESKLTAELAYWQDLDGGQLRLHVGDQDCPAELLTCRPEDRCLGTAHWLQFRLDPDVRRGLADFRRPVFIAVGHEDYRHESDLTEDVRQSLLDDLDLSDRDAAACSSGCG